MALITTSELIRLLKCGGACAENQKVAGEEIERLLSAIATWKDEEAAWKSTEAGLLARVEELETTLSACRRSDRIARYPGVP